ncbi:hypothetical protein [Clostridium grantii]|uniref:Uncharacterized protein n=1 Tax=Clostridium grantii DSM 8605 TaxID=1121316 RepID=A0A1M5VNA6_9CLOT|nr:hypothetical protein [Clostridium grantii]SHH76705.1 hypothetical protein SAMN02745207_02382 [Clostridium grantii DSM 8605]
MMLKNRSSAKLKFITMVIVIVIVVMLIIYKLSYTGKVQTAMEKTNIVFSEIFEIHNIEEGVLVFYETLDAPGMINVGFVKKDF